MNTWFFLHSYNLPVGLGMLFIHQQRRQAVQALIKAEEGERRNYKIDLMALSIDWLIGSGSFGHVYRGEYPALPLYISFINEHTATKIKVPWRRCSYQEIEKTKYGQPAIGGFR